MRTFLRFLSLLAGQTGLQQLERKPEPNSVTDASENVVQYSRVMATKLVLIYAAGIEIVHRARSEESSHSAVDLACGPGHYTLCLARYLGYRDVIGVDLSSPMVSLARQNAAQQGLSDTVSFQTADIVSLEEVLPHSFDLVSFTGAAHHMADLQTVAQVLRQMDQLAKPTGLVMLMDLARLRTRRLTERYIRTLAKDYIERGLAKFLDDFRASMYAVWTPKELRSAIPKQSARWWVHLVPRGLPTIQVVVGLPVGRDRLFARPSWGFDDHPLIRDWYPRWENQVSRGWARETLQDWKLMRLSLLTAGKHWIPPLS